MNKKIFYVTTDSIETLLRGDADFYPSIDKDEAIDEMVEGEKLFLVEITEILTNA